VKDASTEVGVESRREKIRRKRHNLHLRGKAILLRGCFFPSLQFFSTVKAMNISVGRELDFQLDHSLMSDDTFRSKELSVNPVDEMDFQISSFLLHTRRDIRGK